MKLAVHVHVFYKNLWPELKGYLGNVTVPYDLYVTLVEDDKNLISDIKNFNKKTKVWVVENRGYDIGPFVDFLNKTFGKNKMRECIEYSLRLKKMG